MDEKKSKYFSLLQHQVQPYFPNFTASLLDQTFLEQEQGRCAVIDFGEAHSRQITSFTTATELDSYLINSQSLPTILGGGLPRRRLFILEDLPRNYILNLGSHLRIPPSFFAGHWDDPPASVFNHRNPFRRCALPHFRLRYATSNRVEVEVPSGNNSTIFAFDARVSRHLFTYDRNGRVYDEAKSHHVLSFWSSSAREDGSWDAVLLVDPGPGIQVRCLETGELYPLRTRLANDASMPKRFLYPEIEPLLELPASCSQWATAHTSIGYNSMFDDTLRAFGKVNLKTIATADPLSVVELPRKIVMSALIAYLRRRYLNLINIQNNNSIPQMMRQNYLASFSTNSYSNWSSEFFDFIVGSQAAIKVLAREIDDNTAALGLDNTESSAPQWEKDGWLAIKELTGVVAETVDAFAHGYLQYVTIQEARASSGNAQSLSRITVLTMLFVPLSTVASIFSMSGEFLPGQPKAWVFWAAALPLLAVVAYLYWHQVFAEVLQQKKQNLLPLSEKQDCPKLQ